MSDQGPEMSSGTCWEYGQRPYHLGPGSHATEHGFIHSVGGSH